MSLPTPPLRSDGPDVFADRGDAFMAALPAFEARMEEIDTTVAGNAASAAESASVASSVTAYRNATVWSAATNYTLHSTAFSPVDQRVYRRIVAGTSGTDPSADPTNWAPVDIGFRVAVVSLTTQAATAGAHYVLTNVAATTVTLPATPTNGDSVWVTVANELNSNVVARNGKTIMKLAEDMVVDNAYTTLQLRYVNNDWKIL